MSNSKIKKSLETVQSYTTQSSDRLQSFLMNPIQEEITTVPGVGAAAAKTFASENIHNTWQLIGKFCYDFNRDPEKFLAWLNEFKNDAINNAYKKTICRAVTEKVAVMFGDA